MQHKFPIRIAEKNRQDIIFQKQKSQGCIEDLTVNYSPKHIHPAHE